MRQGYMLAEMMIAVVIAGIVAAVFTTMNFYTHVQSNMLKQQNTKTILEVLRSRLIHAAKDQDNDSYFELLKEELDNTLPISVGLGTDAWARRVYYSTIDLGASDGTNAPYADTTIVISPNENIAGRLVSSGEDMVLDTSATDSTAQNDDLMIEIGVGELNHFKLYGGSEIMEETRAYNSAIVSNIEPQSPIEGTLWYDTENTLLKLYDSNSSLWIEL